MYSGRGFHFGLKVFPMFVVFFLALSTGLVKAFETPERSGIAQAEFQLDELKLETEYRLPAELPDQAASRAVADLAVLGLSNRSGRVDVRGAGWASLVMSEPMVPGKGVGNRLKWGDLGRGTPKNDSEFKTAASQAFRGYIDAASQELRIDPTELASKGKVTVHRNQSTVQIYIPRVFNGIPVQNSYLTATINNGNLTMFGTQAWGRINTSVAATIDAGEAMDSVRSHVVAYQIDGAWRQPELALVPVIRGANPASNGIGGGYGYRLAWVLGPEFEGDHRRFEAMVDAQTGELLSFKDTAHYVASIREAKGGVLPVSNDGVTPDGVEQAGWPMPFANVVTPSGTVTTDSGGNLPVPADGNITSSLSGPYVRINDNCGPISLTSSGDIDFGTSGGTDCTTPGFGGAGNTHASRSGFHELNRIIEMGRGQLPTNNWLQQTLTANMNINQNCNATWNGEVNFYTSGGGCANTGELAGVFDHEWGHGLDDNDAIPTIASPSGEGIADVYAALRLNTSCIGRNFRTTNCSGNGDACLSCTGVRDIDYLKRASGQPHDYTWSNANCGGSVHCVGGVYSEAVWSLWKRELKSPPYNYDDHTAHEIVTRLTYIGGGNTGTWFSGGPPFGGCAAGSGYLNFLAADDDNGNLADGTPHMTAIYNAFNDQEIACSTPVVQDSGCVGIATSAPVLTSSVLDKEIGLSWNAVTGADSYEVFRTDGVFGCDFGKVRVGETVSTTWNDPGLQNGRDYSYVVIPKGASAACFGPASNCLTTAPAAGPNVDADLASIALTTTGGDADDFIDNCETGTLTFSISNTGLGDLRNVRITDVTLTSPVGTTILTSFPAAVSPADLAEGAAGTGSFEFQAGGLTFGDDLVFEVSITADEISPTIKTQTFTLADAESDLQFLASKTWDFETDLEGWTVVEGTFNQTTNGGGANGSTGYVASSAFLDNQCDQIRSPLIQLTSTSTLTLANNYEIEANSGQWWDRANVGIAEGGDRSSVDPDGGRLYNASGAGATCATVGQNGWADVNGTWGTSSWSATALDSANYAGTPVQIDIAYGTDFSVNGKGFWFDQVTVTDIELLVADTQTDSCDAAENDPPVVTITAPANGTSFAAGANINFTGTANDTEDGDIAASIGWSSSKDGAIGSGASINTATLSIGTHTITAAVTDSGAPTATPENGSDQITVTVNDAPTVSITAPANGSSATQGDNVNFTGTASDTEDGDIGASIDWTSSLDGTIGSGASVNTTSLSVGTHTITAAVTDSGGLSGEDQITFTVDPAPVTDVNVGAIVTGTQSAPKGRKFGTASVTIRYDNGAPVGAGYTVTGDFSGSYNDSGVSAVTDSNGVALILTTGTAKKNIVVEFCVTGVSGPLPYDSADNADPAYACAPPPPLNDVHVEAIEIGSQGFGGGNKAGTATVTIFGDNGEPQSGYAVSGNFSGDFVEAAGPAVTGSDGSVTFQTSGSKKGKLAVSFCVDSVSGSELYDALDNTDPTYECP
jgi:hypothetical protein